MRIDFDESFELPLDTVESYFRTPADWVRLYGLAAAAPAPDASPGSLPSITA